MAQQTDLFLHGWKRRPKALTVTVHHAGHQYQPSLNVQGPEGSDHQSNMQMTPHAGDAGRILYHYYQRHGIPAARDSMVHPNCAPLVELAPKQVKQQTDKRADRDLVRPVCLLEQRIFEYQLDAPLDDGKHARPEHWKMVRAADTGDDTGKCERDTRGLPPKPFVSCLHNLSAKVTPTRIMSQAQRDKIRDERATFGIRSIIEERLQTKRRGRPSKATMAARAAAGI
jgi:hypothetical protein